jgi:gag-polyprotein putative aspartyl protease
MRYTQQTPTAKLVAFGPIVTVSIEADAELIAERAALGQSLPPPLPVQLMVDTGAQTTVIEEAIAKKFGLKPIRYSSVTGVSQQAQTCAVYRMVITLEMKDNSGQNKVVAIETEIIGVSSPPSPHPHVGLLGRDFLQHFEFVYRGSVGSFELHLAAQT